jgi:cell division protein FtsL
MTRLSSVFWILLVSATALGTFAVKYRVQTLDNQLADARKASADAGRQLRVLNAEWAYLNRPDMLAAMNERFLQLVPITQKQLQTPITDIPMRPPPTPPPVPQTAPIPQTGPVASLNTRPPAADSPSVSPAIEPTQAAEKLAMASTSGRPLLARADTMPDPADPSGPRNRSLASHSRDSRALDNRSLDQLIARIAGDR